MVELLIFLFFYVCVYDHQFLYIAPFSLNSLFTMTPLRILLLDIRIYIYSTCVRTSFLAVPRAPAPVLRNFFVYLFFSPLRASSLHLLPFDALLVILSLSLSLSLSLPSQPRMLFYTHILVYYYYYYYTEQYNKRANIKSVRQCPIPVWWWYTVGYYYFLLILTLYLFSEREREREREITMCTYRAPWYICLHRIGRAAYLTVCTS